LKLVSIGVPFGRQHLRDDEGLERGLVVDRLDLEPDHGERFHDLVERSVGLEMVLQPGEGEFHYCDASMIFRWSIGIPAPVSLCAILCAISFTLELNSKRMIPSKSDG